MKKLLTILCLFLALAQAKAQDTIVKNDKTEIKAKIEEITETTIKYKKFDMLDGPTYNINKRDVFMIIYKNGSKEYMEATVSPPQPAVQNNVQIAAPAAQNGGVNNGNQSKNIGGGHPQILTSANGKHYEFDGVEITSNSDLYAIFEKYGYSDLTAKFKEARTNGYITAGVVLTCLIVGLATGTVVYLGLLGSVVGLGLSKSGAKMITSGIKQFNQRATQKTASNTNAPSFSLDSAQGGIALGN